MEFQWSFANDGTAPSKPLTEVAALDLQARPPDGQFEVESSSGGLDGSLTQGRLGFELSTVANQNVTLSGAGGRSSDNSLPFFLVRAPGANQGVYVGIGWSGQWQADITSKEDHSLAIRAGMPGMNLALPPGEHIIAPSVLLGSFTGEASVGFECVAPPPLRQICAAARRQETAAARLVEPLVHPAERHLRGHSQKAGRLRRRGRQSNISASIPAGSTATFPTASATGR